MRPVRDAKIDKLSHLPLLEGLSTRELAEVAAAAETIEVPRFRDIAQEGAAGDHVYVIIHGMVQVRKGDRIVGYLQDGDVMGELAVLDRTRRTATITTVTDTELMILDRRHLGPLLERSPQVADRLDRVADLRRVA